MTLPHEEKVVKGCNFFGVTASPWPVFSRIQSTRFCAGEKRKRGPRRQQATTAHSTHVRVFVFRRDSLFPHCAVDTSFFRGWKRGHPLAAILCTGKDLHSPAYRDEPQNRELFPQCPRLFPRVRSRRLCNNYSPPPPRQVDPEKKILPQIPQRTVRLSRFERSGVRVDQRGFGGEKGRGMPKIIPVVSTKAGTCNKYRRASSSILETQKKKLFSLLFLILSKQSIFQLKAKPGAPFRRLRCFLSFFSWYLLFDFPGEKEGRLFPPSLPTYPPLSLCKQKV